MLFLEAGCVRLSRPGAAGRVVILDLCRAGDVLGAPSVLEVPPPSTTAVCLEPCVTRKLSGSTLDSLVHERPALAMAVIQNLLGQVQCLWDRIAALSEPRLEERTYAVLANAARTVGKPHPRGRELGVFLSHEEIGRLVGAHRVSVTRALSRLRDAGRIQVDHQNIVVPEAPYTGPRIGQGSERRP